MTTLSLLQASRDAATVMESVAYGVGGAAGQTLFDTADALRAAIAAAEAEEAVREPECRECRAGLHQARSMDLAWFCPDHGAQRLSDYAALTGAEGSVQFTESEFRRQQAEEETRG